MKDVSEVFDDISFAMLRDVRITVESRGGRVIEEFSSPLRQVDEPEKGYLSKMGMVVCNIKGNDSYKIGIIIFFDKKEIPTESKKLRSIFKRKLVRAKKMLLTQYKELEDTHGYVDRPRREESLGEEIQARIQQYLQEV